MRKGNITWKISDLPVLFANVEQAQLTPWRGFLQDYSIHDPELTELGRSQCDDLRKSLKARFEHVAADDVAVVVSPMIRTLQTATLALDWLLDKDVVFEADANWQGG